MHNSWIDMQEVKQRKAPQRTGQLLWWASLTYRLHTMMMTTRAMRKTSPAAAEPMMRGSFSCMLVLYSSANTHTHKRQHYTYKPPTQSANLQWYRRHSCSGESARYPSSTNKEPELVLNLEPQTKLVLRTKIYYIRALGEASTHVISMTTIEIRHGNCRVFFFQIYCLKN